MDMKRKNISEANQFFKTHKCELSKLREELRILVSLKKDK